MTKHKFKVGDKVKNLGGVGGTGVITKLIDEDCEATSKPRYDVNLNTIGDLYINEGLLKLIESKSTHKYKVGDKLKGNACGIIYTITSLDTCPGAYIAINSIGEKFNLGHAENIDYYTKIEDEEIFLMKYSVGNRFVQNGKIITTESVNVRCDSNGNKYVNDQRFMDGLVKLKEGSNCVGTYLGLPIVISLLENKEEQKMELKDMKKKNLKAAKAKVIEERNNAEIRVAEKEYAELIDLKEGYERDLKRVQESLDEVNEELKIFDK